MLKGFLFDAAMQQHKGRKRALSDIALFKVSAIYNVYMAEVLYFSNVLFGCFGAGAALITSFWTPMECW
jgi:hypothetical protein